jgi:hypothetical protein
MADAWDDPRMAVALEHGGRRFQAMAYHDAIRHDGPALELAELVDGELGPALVTVLFAADDASPSGSEVLLVDCDLPLQTLAAFMEEVGREERRLRGRGRSIGSMPRNGSCGA